MKWAGAKVVATGVAALFADATMRNKRISI